ncbi:type II secretion system minor pseudopilin GspK [Endozoicomonas acroporae]|uniref:type II secretion system minor pseudopilin GspK n=1 Tax=Endozoicomonas acroporae TaxID=1701104 RepID=UPI000C786182|nr:type II secretion system minor pseudopilin GspK [Endozoicomonas acroporae]
MMKYRQQGIALVYVLLIYSLMTLMASQILTGLWQQTRKTSHYLDRAQARLYAHSAEQYVALKLEEDAQQDRQSNRWVDHHDEPWHLQGSGYEISDGIITIHVTDEQGQLNINNLAVANTGAHQSLQIVKRLMTSLQLSPLMAYRLKDWVDSDREVSPGGAEDVTYQNLPSPYRAGNTDMASRSELALIAGLDITSEHPLFNELATLPGFLPINLNTASRKVLHSLSEQLTTVEVDALIRARTGNGLANMSELLQISELAPKASLFQSLPLSFNSHFFSATIQVKYREAKFTMHSWFQRDSRGVVHIIRRSLGFVGMDTVVTHPVEEIA